MSAELAVGTAPQGAPARLQQRRGPDLSCRPLRLLVVDDHEVVQCGFRWLLGRQAWVERCLSARSGAHAFELVQRYDVDVALVGIAVAGESGLAVCADLRRELLAIRVVIVADSGCVSACAARAAGASGVIPTTWPAVDISRAVRMVGLGMTIFQPGAENSGVVLSPRERELIGLIAGGSTNREAALELHLSPHTVKGLTSSLYRKLGARNRADAVRRAERLGLSA